MRRLTAIALLLLLALPALVSASANTSSLPACCRRTGAHHCGMTTPTPRTTGATLTALPQHCPLYGRALPSTSHTPASPAPAAAVFARLLSHPAVHAQTQARRRIAEDRSRGKRGPPSLPA